MIAVTRTTRDHAWFILPILVVFDSVFLYITLTTYTVLVPASNSITSDGANAGPMLLVACTVLLGWYVYRLVQPISYVTTVFPDRIVFHDSSKPQDDKVLLRSNIRKVFTQPQRWYYAETAIMSVLYETLDGETCKISQNFVYDATAKQFYDAVASEWGENYVPLPKQPGLLSREIRFWPRRK